MKKNAHAIYANNPDLGSFACHFFMFAKGFLNFFYFILFTSFMMSANGPVK